MNDERTLTLIAESLERGSVPNLGLNRRLRMYKRSERSVTASWLGRDLTKDPEQYASDAKSLGEDWIGLCVDLAAYHGRRLDKKTAATLSNLIAESVSDSLGNIDHSSPIIVGFLPGQ